MPGLSDPDDELDTIVSWDMHEFPQNLATVVMEVEESQELFPPLVGARERPASPGMDVFGAEAPDI